MAGQEPGLACITPSALENNGIYAIVATIKYVKLAIKTDEYYKKTVKWH